MVRGFFMLYCLKRSGCVASVGPGSHHYMLGGARVEFFTSMRQAVFYDLFPALHNAVFDGN